MSEMASRDTDVLFTCGDLQPVIQLFCAFSKEKSAACNPLGVGSYRANGIVYESHYKHAESLLEALDGDKKELITFEYALHGVIDSTPLSQGNETCGMKLLLSYVTNNGNLELLDKSCVDEMPPFNMTLSLEDQYYMMSTDDVYNVFYGMSLYGSLPA
ncbi:unnamed protein product [Peronospora belbahrii]|uniref:Uncharacterized protein n=1 Tax=Peronospora belbahrii TaxID=622444 RepID=A0AAU9LH82_9STRA|nr:unnamed protein product [Peronospora belbahrii]